MIELDKDGFPVWRTFVVEPRTGYAVNPDWFEVRCFRNGRHSGSTPYDYDRAVACVRRLISEGWEVKPADSYTLQFIAGMKGWK